MEAATETEIQKATYHRNYLQFASSDMRNIYLKYAADCFKDGNISHSVYYHLESLCFRFNTKKQFPGKPDLISTTPLPLKDETTHSNLLLDYAKNKFPFNDASKTIETTVPPPKLCIDKELKKIINFRNQLPTEWTIIQITKDYNPNLTISTESQNLQSEFPIYCTILNHPRNTEFPLHSPITIKLHDNYNNIYNRFFNISKKFKPTICFDSKNDEVYSKEKYSRDIFMFANQIHKSIEYLKEFLGPWICLLTGNVDPIDEKLQKEIYQDVDQFCTKNNFNNTQKILLSMLATYPKCLTEINCQLANEKLNPNLGNLDLSKNIRSFLLKQKNRPEKFTKPFKPCLIIIDEMLDHFPWEMINKTQEICRISSFHILQQLYEKYNEKIINGYLHIETDFGNCIINPEKNLEPMEHRMKLFFNYWLPHWECIYGEIPSNHELMNIFSTKDIYVYCGHGSGMQYLNVYKTGLQEIRKSVILLFGCESVKLKSNGLHSELIGEHLYFHSNLCPAVIGFNHVGLDFPLDDYLTKILSNWIHSAEQKLHWNSFDKTQWKKAKLIHLENHQQQSTKLFQYEPKLAAILSQIRNDSTQKMYNIVSLVYRGLPVWNSSLQSSDL